MESLDDVECCIAGLAADEAARRDVARPHMTIEREKGFLWFDDEASPALEVEPEGDIVCYRVA